MTVAPDAPRLLFSDLAGAVRALRRRGLRLSTSRRLVLEALFSADGPVSAEELAQRLELDLGSVYRNLETLERHGLTRHVHLGHGPGRYEVVGCGEREYLYCEHCGAVRALTRQQVDPLRDRARELFGYEVRFTHFPIVGTCTACSRERDRHQDASPLAGHEPHGGPGEQPEPPPSPAPRVARFQAARGAPP